MKKIQKIHTRRMRGPGGGISEEPVARGEDPWNTAASE
jgi:hypothetical protein